MRGEGRGPHSEKKLLSEYHLIIIHSKRLGHGCMYGLQVNELIRANAELKRQLAEEHASTAEKKAVVKKKKGFSAGQVCKYIWPGL